MATPYVTVTDAAGRVLFRRPATQSEIDEAIQVADAADAEAHTTLKRMAAEREANLKALEAEERRAGIPPHPAALEPELAESFPVADTGEQGEPEASAEGDEPHRDIESLPEDHGFPVSAED